MKKMIAILLLIAVLAIALTACGDKNDAYNNDVNDHMNGDDDTSLNDLIDSDLETNDLGDADFIELGDMI